MGFWKYLFLLLIPCLGMAEAKIIHINDSQLPFNIVVSGRTGWDWAKIGHSQYVQTVELYPAPEYFESTEKNDEQGFWGGFLGIEFPFLIKNLRWQTGAGYYQTNSFKTKGIIYDWSLPYLNNREYHYKIKNQRVMFENKFLYRVSKHFYGYVLGGVGAAFNKAYNYYETPLNPATAADSVFVSYTKTSVSYSVGAGIEVILTDYMRGGIGYQYSDLGKTELGDYTLGNTNQTLTTDSTITQELILQLSFVF